LIWLALLLSLALASHGDSRQYLYEATVNSMP
jgi:hypothetical protein